jgi:H+-translocating NAD(P) transhydrogenase subunit alpha
VTQDAPRKVVGVPRESFPGERRAALVPAQVSVLTKAGFEVLIERAAGARAGYLDEEYAEHGAELVDTREGIFQRADIICQVRTAGANRHAGADDFELLRDGQTLIGMCDPLGQPEIMQNLAGRGISIFALELLPRITRAQSMDVLSSMASVAGYKAVLTSATLLPRMFPMMMTAAGTITPGRVFVLGAGVAGLQAIATAKRLGAVVWSYDIRPAVKEEVLSLGAKFLELDLVKTGEDKQSGGYAQQMDEEFYRKQREAMTKQIAESDVIITTAAVPGRKAPILVTEEMVKGMPPGSVIVDIAAEQGGNCELTKANEVIVEHGVTIDGTINLPATVPYHTSQMYAKNIVTFLLHLQKENALDGESDDEIVQDTLVTRGGDVVNARVREALGLTPPPAEETSSEATPPAGESPPVENAASESEAAAPPEAATDSDSANKTAGQDTD